MDNIGIKKSPERTCVVCREKKEKEDFFRLSIEENGSYIFDEKQKNQSRGIYVCKTPYCLEKLWKNRKYSISMEELSKMAGKLKKENKDYINLLKTMRNSQGLTFGINMVLDEMEHIHFLILAKDISEKNSNKLLTKAKELNIPYIYYGTKEELGEIFNKDEITVIAVKNKKIARGLLN